jgi:predicted permease
MSVVLAALIPVFLLIAAGVLVRRFVVTEDHHWIGIERLVYFVLFPALLIDTLALADLSKVPVATVGSALLIAVLLMGAFCLALRPLLTRCSKARRAGRRSRPSRLQATCMASSVLRSRPLPPLR